MRLRAVATVFALSAAAGLSGCGSPSPPASPPAAQRVAPITAAPSAPQAADAGPAAADSNAALPEPGSCKVRKRVGQPAPDPKCTPGAIETDISAANLKQTICSKDYGKTAYPPADVDSRIKRGAAAAYGLEANFEGELDHLVPRMLAGSSEDPRNRWPLVGPKPNAKDRVEVGLHVAVCKGLVALDTVQRALARSWVTAVDDVGLTLTGDPNESFHLSSVCPRGDSSRCAKMHEAYAD